VIADSADHASILDGCLLSRAKLRPFRHNRLDKLEKMLERAVDDGGGVLVVVDGVFSMEGDLAPAAPDRRAEQAHGARLMVDEAHAAGVLGARGGGRLGAVRRRGRRRPAHGHVLRSRSPPAAASSPARTR
jgi:8-amino-7-oxononanoate synthase